MGFWSALGKIGSVAAPIAANFIPGVGPALGAAMGAAGAGLGALGQSQAQNRGAKLTAQGDMERLLLEREAQLQQQQIARQAEGRASGSDAWRKLMAAEHLGTPGARPQNAGPYNVAPRQATEAQLFGADQMKNEVMKRLQGGNPIPEVSQHPLAMDPKLMNPGKMEQFAGLAGAGLSFLGRPQPPDYLAMLLAQNQPQGPQGLYAAPMSPR